MNSRSIISIVFILVSGLVLGQDIRLGLTYQPFIYKSYNKSDWNNRPSSYPVIPNNFNGFAIGPAFQIGLTNNLDIKSEVLYSRQSQAQKISNITGDKQPGVDYFNIDLSTRFEMINLPVMLAGKFELGYESGLFISGYAGGQISYLMTYNQVYREFHFDFGKDEINRDSIINYIHSAPKFTEQQYWDNGGNPPGYKNDYFETDFLYTRFFFGVKGGIEISKQIGDNFSLGLGTRFDYDITNSEKHPELTFSGLGGLGDKGPRAKSNNIRYGLTLSGYYRMVN